MSNRKEDSLYATIGIDPGLTGAIAVISQGGAVERIIDMPVIPKVTGKGKQVNGAALAEELSLILNSHLSVRAYLEQVTSMPRQGVTSMFNFGHGYGIVQGALYALGIPFTLVTPQEWKRYHKLIRKDKDVARTLCIQQYPKFARQLQRKKDIGRADALLIALYGLKQG
jgi:crossover junction endodeoxyribonuclease RuvC